MTPPNLLEHSWYNLGMAKLIVTHLNPDLDAVAAIWLIRKFFPASPPGGSGWSKAKLAFVPAGDTYQGQPVDSDPQVLHVDTGLGEFDHHQTDEYFCSAQKCQAKLKSATKLKAVEEEALERILEIVCEVDHGRDISWPEAENDRYLFFLEDILGGLRSLGKKDEEVVDFGLKALDSVFRMMKDKIRAEETLTGPKAIEFKTQWGKGIAILTSNESVLEVGEKMGYTLVVKKDEKKGGVRIYSRWDRGVDLTAASNQLKKLDSEASWFLHASKCLLLNGSTRNPKMKPTKLSLAEIIAVF